MSIATFEDDTAIVEVSDTSEDVIEKLQLSIDIIHNWIKKWKIKFIFTKKKIQSTPIRINEAQVPYAPYS